MKIQLKIGRENTVKVVTDGCRVVYLVATTTTEMGKKITNTNFGHSTTERKAVSANRPTKKINSTKKNISTTGIK